jgi:hypothetical protein
VERDGCGLICWAVPAFARGTEEDHGEHRDIRCPRRDSNVARPEYTPETLAVAFVFVKGVRFECKAAYLPLSVNSLQEQIGLDAADVNNESS